MLEPQSDQGWEKQLTCSCVGRRPLLTLGSGQLCGPCLWQGPREAGGQAAGTVVPLAGLPAPTPPTSFGFLVPTHAQPTASSLQASVSHILAQPQDPPSYAQWVGTLSVQTPGPLVALTLGPQAEETEIESSPDVWKKSKMQKQKEVKLEPECLGLNHLVTV